MVIRHQYTSISKNLLLDYNIKILNIFYQKTKQVKTTSGTKTKKCKMSQQARETINHLRRRRKRNKIGKRGKININLKGIVEIELDLLKIMY